LDDGADMLSNQDNVSAGGTRYVVGFKGNQKLGFYGAAPDDSISMASGAASAQRNQTAENKNRQFKKNLTMNADSIEGNDELAQAYDESQGGYPDNVSQYSANRSMAGNGNPNKLPGIPTGARPKVATNFNRNESTASAQQKSKHLNYNELPSN